MALTTVSQPPSGAGAHDDSPRGVWNKWEAPECGACWIQTLCFGCAGEDAVRDRAELCAFKQKLAETVLRSLVEIHHD